MILFRFSSNFWKPRLSKNVWDVFAKRFDRLSRNFISVEPSLFARTYPNFMTFDCFFKTKKKISKIKKNLKKFISIRTNSRSEDVGVQFLPPRARISTLDDKETASSHKKSFFRSNTVDIRETEKFWGWPTLPPTIFLPTSYKTGKI